MKVSPHSTLLSHPCRALARGVALLAAAPLGLAAAGTPTAVPAAWRDAVAAVVLPTVALPQPGARVELELGAPGPHLRLAPCRRVEPQLPASGRLWGRSRIGLRCVDGERRWLVWLPLTVKVLAQALVAGRALPAGTQLAAADLQPAEVDWAAEPAAPFARADALLGQTLARALAAGQAPRSDDLRLRQWFAAGDPVQVHARGDGFVVSGEAQALTAGIDGQPVRVRTESGRILTALPVGERRVEVKL